MQKVIFFASDNTMQDKIKGKSSALKKKLRKGLRLAIIKARSS